MKRHLLALVAMTVLLGTPALFGQTQPATVPATQPAVAGAPATAPTTAPVAASRPALLPTGTPTLEEMVRLLDEQKASEVLQHLARIFSSARLTAAYDKTDLLLLKAECLLQNKDTFGALQNFTQAAKEAPDADRTAYAFASELIIRRASAFVYTPKTAAAIKAATGPDNKLITYDIRNPRLRRLAFRVLFLDEVEASKPIIQAAMKATALAPIAKAIQPLSDTQFLERAATGDDVQVRQARQELIEHLQNVVSESLQRMRADVELIRARANEIVELTINNPDPRNPAIILSQTIITRRRGLDGNQTTDLRNTQQTCTSLDGALREFSKRLEADAKSPKLQPLLKVNEDLARRIRDTLTDDYTETHGLR